MKPTLSPAELEARRQKVLKEYIWMRHESHKADPKLAKPAKDDGKKNEDKEPHLDAQSLIKGNLAKGSHTYAFIKGKKASQAQGREYYAWNAWNYLGSIGKGDVRDVYRRSICRWYDFYQADYKPNFYQAFPISALGGHRAIGSYNELKEFVNYIKLEKKTPEQDAQYRYARLCYNLVGQVMAQKNKTPMIGCKLPYTWQAHHILPMNCFYTYLLDWHVRVILSSKYDINAGSNIIFLPQDPGSMKHHQLPHHYGSHPNYDLKLKEAFTNLRKLLNEKKADNQEHEAIAETAEQQLYKMETDAFKYLANQHGLSKLS